MESQARVPGHLQAIGWLLLRFAGPALSSVLCPLSSVLCPLSSALCPLSSALSPLVPHSFPTQPPLFRGTRLAARRLEAGSTGSSKRSRCRRAVSCPANARARSCLSRGCLEQQNPSARRQASQPRLSCTHRPTPA